MFKTFITVVAWAAGIIVGGVLGLAILAAWLEPDLPEPPLDPLVRSKTPDVVSCVMSDSCRVRRSTVQVEGVDFFSVSVGSQVTEVRYLVRDASLKVLVTNRGRPTLLEPDSSGRLLRFIAIGPDGKPQMFMRPDPAFHEHLPDAQAMFDEAMSLAIRDIIPPTI